MKKKNIYSTAELSTQGGNHVSSHRALDSARMFALCALTLIGFSGAQRASAQSAGGSIVGTVRDPSGAAVTGVQLALKNLSNDKTQSTTSDTEGVYHVQNLAAGAYEITASKYGFNDVRTRLILDARRPSRADLKLKLATLAEGTADAADTKKLESDAKLEAMLRRI